MIKDRGASMSPTQRKQAAKAATTAARTLVASGGPKAIRALPKIAKSVRRTAASKGTPPAMRPKVLARTAAKVAQRPGLLRNLSRPSPRGQAIAQRAGTERLGPQHQRAQRRHDHHQRRLTRRGAGGLAMSALVPLSRRERWPRRPGRGPVGWGRGASSRSRRAG